MTGRATGTLGASLQIATTGTNKSDLLYQDQEHNVIGPQWSPDGRQIIFGIGVYNLFFNAFHGLVLKPEDRTEGGAQIAIINADTGHRVNAAPTNGLPSMAPDGKRIDGRSDRMALPADPEHRDESGHQTADGYDNFPLWSPARGRSVFRRAAKGDYEIYTIKPDGTGARRLTFSKGNDAHMTWSPDGEHIVFASTRMGFKDECTYTDAPQPYGELFVMRTDGSDVQQLTDNQWEDGTPAWQPATRVPTTTTSAGQQ